MRGERTPAPLAILWLAAAVAFEAACIGNQHRMASGLEHRGETLRDTGDIDAAIPSYQRAVAIRKRGPEPWPLGLLIRWSERDRPDIAATVSVEARVAASERAFKQARESFAGPLPPTSIDSAAAIPTWSAP